MDCQQCSNNLSAHLDGELLSSFEQEVTSHLQGCKKCHHEFRELEASVEFVAMHSRDLELKPDIWNNLRGRIAPMPVPGHLNRLWGQYRWLTAAAAIAATIVLAIGLWSYVAEQREIRQYMSDYIAEREREEQVRRTRINAVQRIETEAPAFIELENPFGTTRPVSVENPFR
jgi:anti-sigma factor RsiW